MNTAFSFAHVNRGFLLFALLLPGCALAQSAAVSPVPATPSSAAVVTRLDAGSLPDAPEAAGESAGSQSSMPQSSGGVDDRLDSLGRVKIGPRFDPKALDLSQAGEPLSAKNKILLSLDEQTTVYAFTIAVLAAGWAHAINGEPKFGTDSAGFGLQLGAAYLRQTSQAVISDGLFAAALREDPRFYRLGKGRLSRRMLYAASRTWRTRTDAGKPTMNYSLLAGYGAAAALTMTYYPAVSATGSKAARGYGISLGANMLANQYHEFWPDIRRAVFHRHSHP